MNDGEFLYLKRKILELTNIDINGYKDVQMRRRLNMFVSRTQTRNVVSYCHMLEQDMDMLKQLQDFLTINVSQFFRDFPQFEQLRIYILPELLRNRPSLNVWSAGCSGGAEPYSIAILLEEISPCSSHRILATDIDERSLTRASAGGPYSSDDVKNIPAHLLNKYFVMSDGGYRIIDRLKQKMQFRQHNLLCDKFERGLDLLVCRNVTIYFTDEVKSDLNRKFYHSLKDGGILFIGATEIMPADGAIDFTRKGICFYQKATTKSSARVLGRTPASSRT